jgi:hypothetical protein
MIHQLEIIEKAKTALEEFPGIFYGYDEEPYYGYAIQVGDFELVVDAELFEGELDDERRIEIMTAEIRSWMPL